MSAAKEVNTKPSLSIVQSSGSELCCESPPPSTHQRLMPSTSDDAVTVISNADPYSTVAHLRLDKCSLVDKPDYPVNESWEDMRDRICDLVRVPPLFDTASREVLEVVSERYRPTSTETTLTLADLSLGAPTSTRIHPSTCLQDDWIAFGEVSAEETSDSLEDEVRGCFELLESQ